MVHNGRVYPDHACVHEFLDFCNPYGVICTFYRVPHGTGCRDPNGRRRPGGDAVVALGGPKNTSEHSRMVQNGRVCHKRACVHPYVCDRRNLRYEWYVGSMCDRRNLHWTPTRSTLWERSADILVVILSEGLRPCRQPPTTLGRKNHGQSIIGLLCSVPCWALENMQITS